MCTQSLPWWPINPVARRPSPWFNFQLDLVRTHVGRPAGGNPVGRQLPAGARLGGVRRPGSRAPGGRRLRREHRRRDHRRARRRACSSCRWHRQPALRAASHHHLRALGAAGSRGGTARQTAAAASQFAGTIPIIVAAVCAALLARNVPAIPPLLIAYGRYAVTRIGQADDHLLGRRLERVGRGVASAGRRAELSQRRQGPGVERAAGHAAAADARPHDDAHPEEPEARAGHRLRRRRDRGRSVHRSESRAADDRRDRAARAPRRLHLLRRTQLQRRQEPQDARAPRRRAATTCRRRTRSSTRSRRIRSTRGSRARRCSTRGSSSSSQSVT